MDQERSAGQSIRFWGRSRGATHSDEGNLILRGRYILSMCRIGYKAVGRPHAVRTAGRHSQRWALVIRSDAIAKVVGANLGREGVFLVDAGEALGFVRQVIGDRVVDRLVFRDCGIDPIRRHFMGTQPRHGISHQANQLAQAGVA